MIHAEDAYTVKVPSADQAVAARLSLRDGKILLATGDMVALLVPMLLATWDRRGASLQFISSVELLSLFGSTALWFLLALSSNLYSLSRAASYPRTHLATVAAAFVVLTARSLYELPSLTGPLWLKASLAITAVVLFAIWRTLFCAAARKFPFARRVLVVGAGRSGGILAAAVAENQLRGDRGFQLVGFVDDEETKVGQLHAGLPVLGKTETLMDWVKQLGVDTICLSINRTPVLSAGVFTGLVTAREQGVRITSMPQMYEDLMQKVAVEHVGNNWGVMFPVEQPRHLLLHDVFVRILDVAAGIVGLALTALLMPFIALANACGGSPGPIFYRQLRVGKSGRNFSIVKFRSMTVNAESNGAQWSTHGDPRITPVGRFLRRTRLDELPQFWNILKGEMSLIGPRPERPEFVAKLAESIPFYRARHAVKPGLTGWAQVKYRYGSSEEDSLIKLQYDLCYIKHRSPVLDLRIISKTIRVVLTAAGQ